MKSSSLLFPPAASPSSLVGLPDTIVKAIGNRPFVAPMSGSGPNVVDDWKNWVPLKEAAHLLHVSRRTIVRMCEAITPNTGRAYLRFWRPTPGTMMICRQSLQEFCRITQNDPEFWQRRGKETKPLSATAVKRSRRRLRRRRKRGVNET